MVVIYLNGGIRVQPPCGPTVTTAQHGGQTKSLWDHNRGLRGIELGAELSVGESGGLRINRPLGCGLQGLIEQ